MEKIITLLRNYDNKFVHLKAGTPGVNVKDTDLWKFTDIGSELFCMSYMSEHKDILFRIRDRPTQTAIFKLEYETTDDYGPLMPEFIGRCLTSSLFTELLDNLKVTIVPQEDTCNVFR